MNPWKPYISFWLKQMTALHVLRYWSVKTWDIESVTLQTVRRWKCYLTNCEAWCKFTNMGDVHQVHRYGWSAHILSCQQINLPSWISWNCLADTQTMSSTTWHQACCHGRRLGPPWILKILAKKVIFLVSSGKKQISAPLEKFLKNPLVAPSWKISFRRPCP